MTFPYEPKSQTMFITLCNINIFLNFKVWNLETGCCISTLDWMTSEGHTGVIRCLQADTWRIVSSSDDKTIKVWELESGQRLVTLR